MSMSRKGLQRADAMIADLADYEKLPAAAMPRRTGWMVDFAVSLPWQRKTPTQEIPAFPSNCSSRDVSPD
jgi:hypothetical protein